MKICSWFKKKGPTSTAVNYKKDPTKIVAERVVKYKKSNQSGAYFGLLRWLPDAPRIDDLSEHPYICYEEGYNSDGIFIKRRYGVDSIPVNDLEYVEQEKLVPVPILYSDSRKAKKSKTGAKK